MTIISVSGSEPIPAKGVASMEHTIGSKTLATAFFVVEVKGSYNLIFGQDRIHGNRCAPSSLHQFLIQWVDDVVKLSTHIHRPQLPLLMLLRSGGTMLLLVYPGVILHILSLLVLLYPFL